MNLFTRNSSSALMPERVEIPGVDQDEVESLQRRFDDYARTRLGFLLAMRAKGSMPYQGTVPGHVKAQRRAAGKRQRRARKTHRGR